MSMFKYLKHLLLLIPLLACVQVMNGQGTSQVQLNPDCVVTSVVLKLTAGSPATMTLPGGNGFDNRGTACQTFVLEYVATATSGTLTSISFQGAAGAITPGTFGAYGGTVSTGINPNTSNTGAISTFSVGCASSSACTVSNSWLNVLLTRNNFVGTIQLVVYGWRQGSAKAGGGGGGGGGGGPTIAGTANEITVTGAGCTTGSTATCTISIPANSILPGTVTAGGFISNEAFSGSLFLGGLTSGNVVFAAADIAGTAIVYVVPSTNGSTNKFLQDTGVTTCPTLPAGYPTVCHLLAWAAGGGGGGYATIQNGGSSLPAETVLNFVLGGCVDNPAVSTDCTIGAGSGGPVVGYSAAAITLPAAGTTFLPPAGGGLASTTEATVQASAPTASPISNMYVTLGTAIGTGNTIAITFRDAGASQTLTCTISGASALKCNDIVHSFTPTVGDALDIQIVTTGIVAVAPNIQILYEYGSSGGGGGGGVSYKYQYYPAGQAGTQWGYASTGPFSSGNPFNLPASGSTGSISGLALTEFRSSGDDGIVLAELPCAGTVGSCTSGAGTWDGSPLILVLDAAFPDNNSGTASFQAYSSCVPIGSTIQTLTWTAAGANIANSSPGSGGLMSQWKLSVPVTGCSPGNFVYIDVRRPSTDSYTSTIFSLGISIGIKY